MSNIFKIRNILSLTKSIFFILLLLISFISEAKTIKRSNGIRGNKKSKITTKKVSKIETSSSLKENLDTSHITKYNCEDLYYKCMNEICFSNTNGRCNCNTLSIFEKAHSKCEYILDVYPYLKEDVISSFKRTAKSDCTDYVMQNSSNTTALSNVLANLIKCIQPKCRANRDEEFVNCFDKDNMENKLKLCENTYANVSDKNTLIEMLEKNMLIYKTKYCEEVMGSIKNGECYITIGIGPSFKDIKKIKEFKIGDEIICSEEAFNTELGASEHQKIRQVKDVVVSGINVVKGGVDIAQSVVSSDTVGIMAGTGETLSAVAPAVPAIMELTSNKDYSYKGYCYIIKGNQKKELFEANNEIYYKLRWAPSWSERRFITPKDMEKNK